MNRKQKILFVSAGLIGVGVALLLYIFDLYLAAETNPNWSFSWSLLLLALYPGKLSIFYLVNFLKYFLVFGLFWLYFKKAKSSWSKKKLIWTSIIGGSLGVVILFIIQGMGYTFVNDFLLETHFGTSLINGPLGMLFLGIIYPPPFLLYFFGIILIFPTTLILNALIGMIIVYSLLSKNGK